MSDDHATISDRLQQLHRSDQGRASHVVTGLRSQLRQSAEQLADLDDETTEDPSEMTLAEFAELVATLRELGENLENIASDGALVLADLRSVDDGEE